MLPLREESSPNSLPWRQILVSARPATPMIFLKALLFWMYLLFLQGRLCLLFLFLQGVGGISRENIPCLLWGARKRRSGHASLCSFGGICSAITTRPKPRTRAELSSLCSLPLKCWEWGWSLSFQSTPEQHHWDHRQHHQQRHRHHRHTDTTTASTPKHYRPTGTAAIARCSRSSNCNTSSWETAKQAVTNPTCSEDVCRCKAEQ